MRVLFIGGTGIISSACAPLALDAGVELFLPNRGTSRRPAPAGAQLLHADPVRRVVDPHLDAVMDRMIADLATAAVGVGA